MTLNRKFFPSLFISALLLVLSPYSFVFATSDIAAESNTGLREFTSYITESVQTFLCIFDIGTCPASDNQESRSFLLLATNKDANQNKESSKKIVIDDAKPVTIQNITKPVVEKVVRTREIVRDPDFTYKQFNEELTRRINDLRQELSRNTVYDDTSIWQTISQMNAAAGGGHTTYYAGTGLTLSGATFISDLGTSIESSEITDGSVVSADIADDTIVNADISSSAAISLSKTALVAGTNITLSGDTLNVDDAFLLNTGDTATGDYNFDSGTFVIDASKNRIGLGVASPKAQLDIKADYGTALTGTVSLDGGSNIMTGTGTAFDTELSVGDPVRVDFQVFTVTAISSATSLTLNQNSATGVTGATAYTEDDFLVIKDWVDQPQFIVNRFGNVGIGTSTPTYKLDVSGTLRSTGLATFDAGLNVNSETVTDFTGSNLSLSGGVLNVDDAFLLNTGDTATGDYNFDSGTFVIDSVNNKVGVGTSAPVRNFEVSGTGNTTLRVTSTDGAVPRVELYQPGNSLYDWSIRNTSNDLRFSYSTDDFSTVSTVLAIEQGDVGINETSPDAVLEISLDGDTAQDALMISADDGDDGNLFMVTALGNVGIGTTNPGAALHVGDTAPDLSSWGVPGGNPEQGVKITTETDGGTAGIMVGVDDSTGRNSRASLFLTDNDQWGLFQTFSSGGSLPFTLSVGGLERMRITTSGNVGIGTTSPAQTLSVAGQLGLLEGGTGPQYYTIFQGGDQTADITYTLPVSIGSNGQVLTTDGSGVLSWQSITSGLFTDGGTTTYLTSQTDDFALGGTGSGAPLFFDESAELLTLTNITGGNSFVVNDQASDTTPFVIDADGDVGIGTTNPLAKLHIQQDGTTSGLINYGGRGLIISGNDSYSRIIWESINGPTGQKSFIIDNKAGDINFSSVSDNGGSWTNQNILVVQHDGKVGIGTASPSDKLHISGGATMEGNRPFLALKHTGTAGYAAGISWFQNNTKEMELFYNTSNDEMYFWDSIGGASRMTIERGGKVGIGTDTPGARLHVRGDAQTAAIITDGSGNYKTDWPSGWGGGLATFDIVGASAYLDGVQNRSDERWKKNIVQIDNALEKVNDLRGVIYEWDIEKYPENGFKEGRQLGFIAQDFERVFPDVENLVQETDEGYKSLSYSSITALNLQAIKELWDIVKENTDKITQLFNKDAELEARIAQLEAQLASLSTASAQQSPSVANNSTDTEDTEVSESLVPTITILGNNPANIKVGSTYSDLGATAQSPDGADISIITSLDGVEVDNVEIDTSTEATYVVEYKVVWEGEEFVSVRDVKVVDNSSHETTQGSTVDMQDSDTSTEQDDSSFDEQEETTSQNTSEQGDSSAEDIILDNDDTTQGATDPAESDTQSTEQDASI